MKTPPEDALVEGLRSALAERKFTLRMDPVSFNPYVAPGCMGQNWSLLINTLRFDWTSVHSDSVFVLADLIRFQRLGMGSYHAFLAAHQIKPSNTSEEKDATWQYEVAKRRFSLLKEKNLTWLLSVGLKPASPPKAVPQPPPDRAQTNPGMRLF